MFPQSEKNQANKWASLDGDTSIRLENGGKGANVEVESETQDLNKLKFKYLSGVSSLPWLYDW